MKNEEKKPSKRSWIIVLVVVLVIILLLFVIDLDDLIDTFRQLKPGPLVLGSVIMIVGLVLISFRWRYLLDNRVPFWTAFHTDSISYMIRMFTPIHEALLRVATLSMATSVNTSQATPAIMAERLVELVMRLVALVLAAILISTSGVASGWVIIWVILLALLFIGLVRFSTQADQYLPRLSGWLSDRLLMDEERLEGPLSSLGEGFKSVGTARRLIVTLLWSLLMWGAFLFSQAFLLEAVNIDEGFVEALAISAAVLVVLPPSSPAMIVVYQGVMVTLLLPFRIADGSTLLVYSILVFAVQMVFWVITGLWGLRRTRLQVATLIKLPGLKKEKSSPEDENSVHSPESHD